MVQRRQIRYTCRTADDPRSGPHGREEKDDYGQSPTPSVVSRLADAAPDGAGRRRAGRSRRRPRRWEELTVVQTTRLRHADRPKHLRVPRRAGSVIVFPHHGDTTAGPHRRGAPKGDRRGDRETAARRSLAARIATVD